MSLAADAGAMLMVLHTAASRVGGMDIGFAHSDGLAACEGARVVYSLGADEVEIDGDPFVIYHGSHGDRGAHRADVILPGAAYTEQSGIFVNLEGRPQMAFRANFPPGEAKEDWAILRALSGELNQTLPFDTLEELRRQLFKAHPHLAALDRVPENEWRPVEAGRMEDAPIRALRADHYLVNPVLRASELMAEMSRLAAGRATAIAAE
jgi:NADH-quinone oxidoreductase subunit G